MLGGKYQNSYVGIIENDVRTEREWAVSRGLSCRGSRQLCRRSRGLWFWRVYQQQIEKELLLNSTLDHYPGARMLQ
jgi:hypothetical protein